MALANGPHINNPVLPPERSEAGYAALARARAASAGASPVEKALIVALTARYVSPPPEDRRHLELSYANAMRAVWAAFPKDADVGALFAEALADLRPWDFWLPDGKPQPGTEELVATLEGVIALLRRLEALSWSAQVVSLALVLAGYALLLLIAWRIGGRNSADLKDENAALEKQVAESDTKRRELRDKESKLGKSIRGLQVQCPEEHLARAAKEREHGNEELAIQLYEKTLATFGPDLARCCEALGAGSDEPEAERYRRLAVLLAGLGAQR